MRECEVLPIYLPTILPTNLPSYLPTYLPTYIPPPHTYTCFRPLPGLPFMIPIVFVSAPHSTPFRYTVKSVSVPTKVPFGSSVCPFRSVPISSGPFRYVQARFGKL